MPAVYRTQINDVLLTALALAYGRWSGQPPPAGGPGGARPRGAVRRRRPVAHRGLVHHAVPGAAGGARRGAGRARRLQAVKEQLRAVPNRGLGYGLLRYLAGTRRLTQRLRALPAARVCFNYLGQVDRGLPAEAGRGPGG